MWNRAAAFLFIALAAISSAHAAPQTISVTGPWEVVTFEVNSWGKPVTSWYITPEGGNWIESKDGATFQDYSLITHEVTADEQKFAALSAIIARLPAHIPEYEHCQNRMTDAPYGKLRLTRGAATVEISYNAGCLDADYAAFLHVLMDADHFVHEWGKDGKVLRTEQHGASQQQ